MKWQSIIPPIKLGILKSSKETAKPIALYLDRPWARKNSTLPLCQDPGVRAFFVNGNALCIRSQTTRMRPEPAKPVFSLSF